MMAMIIGTVVVTVLVMMAELVIMAKVMVIMAVVVVIMMMVVMVDMMMGVRAVVLESDLKRIGIFPFPTPQPVSGLLSEGQCQIP